MLAGTLLFARVATAQSTARTIPARGLDSASIGAYARIARVGIGREEGKVKAVSPSLRLERRGATREFAWPSVDTLWVRGRGALPGTLAGATLGGVLTMVVSSSADNFYGVSRGYGTVTLQGAAVGAVVGLLVGSMIKPWSRRFPQ